jgi:hypothetical protein
MELLFLSLAFLFTFLGDGTWHHTSPEHGKLNGQEKELTDEQLCL